MSENNVLETEGIKEQEGESLNEILRVRGETARTSKE